MNTEDNKTRKELTFGTGGIRAIMGEEDDQINLRTIRRNTEGYARYVLEKGGASVVVAYDNRKNSREFARETAEVLAARGIEVYLFEDLRPTPELSFAIRHLGAFGGVVITASHNPPEYNGYKIYDQYGCQCVPRDTDQIIEHIRRTPLQTRAAGTGAQPQDTRIHLIGQEVDEAYYRALEGIQLAPGQKRNIRIVYTPLHGTGYIPVTTMLKRLGHQVIPVEEQCAPDAGFTNAASPNPEDESAFDRAILLAKETDAELILATDPDCDRLGVMVRDKGRYVRLTGSQLGTLFLAYILEAKAGRGAIPKNAVVCHSVVTGGQGDRICEKYGVETENTLTGFKYIGGRIRENEGKKEFLFGYEESCGYLFSPMTRDKDGVQAAIMAAEACSEYRKKGMTLLDALEKIRKEFGQCEESRQTRSFPGSAGRKDMEEEMRRWRTKNITELEGRKVAAREDYLTSTRTLASGTEEPIDLPKTNMIRFVLEDGSWVAIRPSGNEPKLKIYRNLL